MPRTPVNTDFILDDDIIVINRVDSDSRGARTPVKISGLEFKQALAGSTEITQEITNIINNIFVDGAPELPPKPNDGNVYYLQLNADNTLSWELVSDINQDNNVDGGFANSVYLPIQNINGGVA